MAERRYRKGDRVRFQVGLRYIEGVVKEDRGPLGVKGRHLYTVRFPFEREGETMAEATFPAVDLEPVDEPAPAG